MKGESHSSLVLEDQDLLERIFLHFLTDAPSQANHKPSKIAAPVISVPPLDRHALREAALTCKIFSEAALNVLWCIMDQVGPLLVLIDGVRIVNGEHMLTRAITNKSMERFDLYARRICQFSFYPGRDLRTGGFTNLLLFTLLRLRPNGLLPRLTKLHLGQPLSQETICANSWIIPFIPSTLSMAYLHVMDDAGGTFICNLLSITNPDSPPLQHLSFQGHLSPQTTSYIIGFRQLSRLQLTIAAVGRDTLDSISTLKVLSYLEISFTKLKDNFVGNTIRMQDTLTTLSLYGRGDDLQTLLSSIVAPHLTSIELKFRLLSTSIFISQYKTRCGSCFPSLSRLAFVNDGPPILTTHSFSELVQAQLQYLGNSGENLQTLLASIVAARLMAMEVKFRLPPASSSQSQCLTRLRGSIPLSYLTFVNGRLLILVTSSLLELFQTRLQYLEIWSYFHGGLKSIRMILPHTTNWNDLTTIRLPRNRTPGILDPDHIPLEALPQFALGCPRLRSLELGVFLRPDATTPKAWNQFKPLTYNHGLSDLRICFVNQTEIRNSLSAYLGMVIGGFIYLIFPLLQRMSDSNLADDEQAKTWWRDAFMFVETLQDVKVKMESRVSE